MIVKDVKGTNVIDRQTLILNRLKDFCVAGHSSSRARNPLRCFCFTAAVEKEEEEEKQLWLIYITISRELSSF